MNINSIGDFIATLRKEKGMTQNQLAERLNISQKTVSKWERGRGLPDVSLMLPLCRVLEIDVNELLSGQRLDAVKYRESAESNILKLMDKTSPRLKYTICTLAAIATILLALGLVIIAGFAVPFIWLKILMLAMAVILVVSNVSVILLVAVNTEIYTCCHCSERFVPTMREYIMGAHTMKKRYLKCPHCHKSGWNKFDVLDSFKKL